MSKLLINEPPLQVLPTLAAKIGLNESIVLQQIHYWISNPKAGKEHEGRRWVYNSVREWQEDNFPFWSRATIKRALASLREQGLLLAENLNASTYDRTLWYTIDYEAVNAIGTNCTNGVCQDDQMDGSNLTQPIPETTTETKSERETARDDEEYQRAKSAYENWLAQLVTPLLERKIRQDIATHGLDNVLEAIGVAQANKAYSWRYVEVTLENWRVSGKNHQSRPAPKAPAQTGPVSMLLPDGTVYEVKHNARAN